MCLLLISYKPERDDTCMGCQIGVFPGSALVKWCETGEEAINHVAKLNGYNELRSADYEHFFIYPDDNCPYDEKDEETGEVTYKPNCIPLSKVDHDLEEEGGIPEHLRGPIEAKEKEFRKLAEEQRKCQQEAKKESMKECRRKEDERQLEYLKEKLGK